MTNPAIPLGVKQLRDDPGRRPLDPGLEGSNLVRGEILPPKFLTGYAREEWIRLVPILVRMRLLSTADVNTLAQYCLAYSRWRTAEESIAVAAEDDVGGHKGLFVKRSPNSKAQTFVVNPAIALAHNAGMEMCKYGGELGLTPASRARIVAGGAKGGAGKFEGLLSAADN